MRKKIGFVSFLLGLPFWLFAQQADKVKVSGTMEGEGFVNPKLYVKAMDRQGQEAVAALKVDGTRFTGEVLPARDGFYQFFGVNNQSQLILPLYLPQGVQLEDLKLTMVNACPQMNIDKNNRALSAYNELTYAKGRALWVDGQNMTSDQLFDLVNGFNLAVDSIVNATHCDAPVEQYLRLWAYNQVANSYMSLPRILGVGRDVSFKKSDVLAEPEEVLDSPMTVYFPASVHLILASLPQGNLNEQFAALYQKYSCKEVRGMVEGGLIDHFIRNFNFEKGYENGLADLSSVIEKYQLDTRYLDAFKMRKASAKGSPFPEGILLTDVNGNKVDFSSFKGSYVYIDMWASWCGPCCKEAPVLKKLEQEVKNPNVKFVSISIDKSIPAWKKKMEALGLHGNQLLNQDNKLAEALNVKGIPMFLIYDKEGKLYMYNAPRPSTGAPLKELLEGLK